MTNSVGPKAFPLTVVIAVLCLCLSANAQSPTPQPAPEPQPSPTAPPLTIDEALRLATTQASNYQSALLNEASVAEDVKQARAAFLPKVSLPLSYIYTTPALGLPPGEPRVQSFIANNAIGEYSALLNVAGDFDVAGKLRATLARNRALLAAAHASSEVARRALSQAVIESYYNLSLSLAERRAADENLVAAEEFERVTSLLLSGGEVAPVDLTRAQLQTLSRRDELQKARAAEQIASASLRVLIGYDFSRSLTTTDLALAVPVDVEIQDFKAGDVARRPEFTQLDQQLRAAQQEMKIARADRLPSLSYSINGGFDTDSLKGPRLKQHTGASAAVSFSIPIFDWGARRSKEKQARLRVEAAENDQTLALRALTQEFYAAQAQASSAAARIRLARESVSKAQDNLSASIARYRAGEAQIIEVTDAQTTLVAQRSAFYQALFDYQLALARLKLATGR